MPEELAHRPLRRPGAMGDRGKHMAQIMGPETAWEARQGHDVSPCVVGVGDSRFALPWANHEEIRAESDGMGHGIPSAPQDLNGGRGDPGTPGKQWGYPEKELKIPRLKSRAGSTPAPGTKLVRYLTSDI